VFLKSILIAYACNRVWRKRFLKPCTIGLIPTGGYTGNVNYSKKALMWLVHREQTDGCKILHGGNGREYRLPDVPDLSLDGFCVETGTVYEFFGWLWPGNTCLHFRDVSTASGRTLAERYEQTMQKLDKITRAGYQVIVQWECEFDRDILSNHPELETHPVVDREPLNTRDALYGGRTEAMRLHYKAREGETIQYCDVMSLYPYICKYFKFPIGHPVIHVGESCRDMHAMLQKDGLMKCSILPPRHIYHPILPFRCKLRLLLLLCRTCAVEQNQTVARTHDTVAPSDLVGTWVLIRLGWPCRRDTVF
jgi:hypothetical protein